MSSSTSSLTTAMDAFKCTPFLSPWRRTSCPVTPPRDGRTNLKHFLMEQRPLLALKYPFLTPQQIKRRGKELWCKLSSKAKKANTAAPSMRYYIVYPVWVFETAFPVFILFDLSFSIWISFNCFGDVLPSGGQVVYILIAFVFRVKPDQSGHHCDCAASPLITAILLQLAGSGQCKLINHIFRNVHCRCVSTKMCFTVVYSIR